MRPAYESRLLGVERTLGILGRKAATLERETWAGLQDARQLEQEVPPAAPTCTGSIDVTVTVGTTPVVGAAVTLSGAGSGTGTTDASGFVSIAITAAGSYTVTVSAIGCTSAATATVAATCTTNTVAIHPTSTALVTATIKGCATGDPLHNLVPNAVLTLTKSGVSYTGTSDASGNVSIDVGPSGAGSYSWTLTHPSGRFVTRTGTVTVSCTTGGAVGTQTFVAATGYVQNPNKNCVFPVATTLHLTKPHGNLTLTFATGVFTGWSGTEVVAGTTYIWRFNGDTFVALTNLTTTKTSDACPLSFSWAGTATSTPNADYSASSISLAE